MTADHRVTRVYRPLYAWTADEPNPSAHARRQLRTALADLWVPPDTVQDALVMVSELTTNAHCHAPGPYRLGLGLTDAAFVVEVRDGDPRQPRLPITVAGSPESGGEGAEDELDDRLPMLTESGRGLRIVHALSHGRWGFRTELPGKVAWFALARSASSPPGR